MKATQGSQRDSDKFMPILSVIIVIVVASTVLLQARWNRAVDWSKPDMIRPAYRGADGAAIPPRYSEQELSEFAALLQDAVATKLPAHRFRLTLRPRTQFTIGTQFQEMFDGALAVQVQILSYKDNTLVKEEKRDFASAEDFRAQADALAASIAGDITALMQN